MIIRKAVREDIPAIAAIHAGSWKTAYRGIVADEFLDSLESGTFIRRWLKIFEQQPLVLVAELSGGNLAGFIRGGPSRFPELPFDAELYAVYLLPEVHRQGIGRKLFRELVRELVLRGHRSMLVRVLKENPACRFYERMGGRPVAESTVDIGGHPYADIAYGWPSLPDPAG